METPSRGDVAWYHKPIWVAVLALFVLGPLALPLVWRSPAFSTAARWVATVLILLYTVLMVWQTILVAELVATQLQLQLQNP